MGPELTTHPLVRADGSATLTSKLFTVLAAVNGPVEVQRRDELPEEAAIEVNVRPSSGAGGPRERWLEGVIAALLKSVLLVHVHPRTLIQVTLQITKEPAMRLRRTTKDIATVSTLANAAFLVLVDGGLPLERTMVSGLAAVGKDGDVVIDPVEKQLADCKSVHTMAFTSQGDLLLDESAGDFDLEQWQDVVEQLKKTCMAAMAPASEDESMINGNAEATPWLRQTLEEDVRDAAAWRDGG